jgi:hypothetical protein
MHLRHESSSTLISQNSQHRVSFKQRQPGSETDLFRIDEEGYFIGGDSITNQIYNDRWESPHSTSFTVVPFSFPQKVPFKIWVSLD